MFYEGVQASRSHCIHSSNSHVFQYAQFCKLCYLAWVEGSLRLISPPKGCQLWRMELGETEAVWHPGMCMLCAEAGELSPLMGAAGLWHLPLLKQVSQKCHLASCQLSAAWCFSPLLSAHCWELLVWARDGKEWEKLLSNCLITVMVTFDLTE